MPTTRPDGSLYVSAYIGRGDDGVRIMATLRAGAHKAGLSLSEFLIRAGLEKAHVSDKTQKTKKPLSPAIALPIDDLPPSIRASLAPAIAHASPAKPRRARHADDDDGALPPRIDELAPSSKPASAE